ncbi:hypothetical protein CEV32_2880 [Brucella rhizosphaerae]|uniref:Uncharacterized protein n=1 Tax=Brucella rhizosphaerae TaxID=571254 RepID=A0A256EZV7_9HYPH|nr:hypothetical protein CEV32_2880 [Brucella rhizosphaerae]
MRSEQMICRDKLIDNQPGSATRMQLYSERIRAFDTIARG